MGECCKKGSFHQGATKGTETTVLGLPAYVVGPENAKVGIFIATDFYGYKLNNTRRLADKYADATGYRVYIPDLLNGDPADYRALVDPNFDYDVPGWLSKHPPRDQGLFQSVDKIAEEIKNNHGQLGAIGFCWGAPSALRLGRKGGPAKAVAVAHPTATENSDFENLAVPALFLTAEEDPMFTEDKKASALEATKNLRKDGLYSKWVFYPGTSHGFAIRGDEFDEPVAFAMQDACNEAVNHWKLFLV